LEVTVDITEQILIDGGIEAEVPIRIRGHRVRRSLEKDLHIRERL